MKKVITICLLVVTLLVGGMTMDAKTSKKKSSKSSSSATWNGDIPSAAIIVNPHKYDSQLINHGYRDDYTGFIKSGVCEFHHMGTSGGWVIDIEIPDSSKRNWLYNNIKSYIRNSKDKTIRKSKVRLYDTGIGWDIN